MYEHTMKKAGSPVPPLEFGDAAPTAEKITSMPVIIHAGREIEGFVIAINERGILAALPESVPAEKIVEVEFEMPDDDRRMRVVGEVSWSNFYVGSEGIGFSGVGIEFFGIGEEGRKYLEDFVSANEGEEYWQQLALDEVV